jgi:hypothetical protein
MNRLEKWSVWISLCLTSGSGVGLLWTKYLVAANDPWAAINHPLQPWFLKIHIVTSPFLIFALGLVTSRHILPRLRSRRRGWSGVVLLLVVVPLVITGYLIQTVIEPGWLRVLAVAHIGLGLLYAMGYAVHQARATLLSAKRTEPGGGRPIRWASRAGTAVVTSEVEFDQRGQRAGQPTKKLH